MTAKQKVLKLAKELGAEVDYYGSGVHFEVTVDAPEGFHWACDVITQIVGSIWDEDTPAMIWKDVLERMEYGLEPCDDECGHLE